MPTNEMNLTKAFREEAGLEQAKAERLATTIFDAIRDNVATKSDLREMEQRIDLKFAAIDTRLEKLLRLSLGVIGIVAAGVGVLFGMLHLWLPH